MTSKTARRALFLLLSITLAIAATACGSDAPEDEDGGVGTDASPGLDGGAEMDAAPPMDGSVETDGGTDEDGGPDEDGGSDDDAGPDGDAGPGEDGGPATCDDNEDCEEGEFCAASACGEEGVCEGRPELCPTVEMPVCGCDSVTYGNSCLANAAGVNVASEGRCRCTENTECSVAEYCAKDDCIGDGECTPRPGGDCAGSDDPVCGCDGRTYDHACLAAHAGVNVSSSGPCVSVCTSNADCAADTEFCDKRDADCGGVGRCRDRPNICVSPIPGEEVCGCDRTTYGNRCTANSAGVTIAHEGECASLGCDDAPMGCCYQDEDCDAARSLRCVGAMCRPGSPGQPGTCVNAIIEEGRCWTQSDCDPGTVCRGVQRCPCGSFCFVEDSPGWCHATIDPPPDPIE